MAKVFSPADALRLSAQMGLMTLEAQTVITLRLWGMMGLWNTAPGENRRMIAEKGVAALASGRAAGRSLAAGDEAGHVALAAIAPLRAKTRANARRLAGRGPKTKG
ncbi:antifreeze protein [Fertoebacter nigrum]|uniref:Antifreeze protein n=1 Tax=Fertoeibacter niger TaxID=2656921 RepID=A0A8X8KJV3_9RHOB|nr:antifreeze protein [Fertoeibacter niger]NUB43609.1 antifreeze protein [Fertoeibacter niger]